MKPNKNPQEWDEVLDFWFPERRALNVDAQTHRAHWFWRMQGGADELIVARFADLAGKAAGALDHWALDPHGRLALIVILDQFSRSVWRDSARAYAQDPRALTLVTEGLANGHYSSLETPWFQVVFGLPLGHCEGPDHLQRLDLLIGLRRKIAAEAPISLRPIYAALVEQASDVRKIIAAFGRHPHRNMVLGRTSTAEEEAYIAKGEFPHRKAFR
ncbi:MULTISPECIES: DUF924 family protein [Mesorhizobium]|uniref:DUF924 family protein n=1 Tax=Mesorhizobium TaxID=68287 RepID=UPI0018F790C7|nr:MULTISPECIES: DUF924 family protein [Mesorhizobium]